MLVALCANLFCSSFTELPHRTVLKHEREETEEAESAVAALRRRVESEREVITSLDANIQTLRARVANLREGPFFPCLSPRLPSEDFSQNGNASAILWPCTPNPWTRSCALMNGLWASISRVWVLTSFCFAIPSKVATTQGLRTRRALCLTSHPNRHLKVRCVVCNRSICELKLFDSINVDTAIVDYASTSRSFE